MADTRFIEKVKQNKKDGLSLKKAADTAVDWAISENLLDGYFKERKAEVMGMILHEFDQEKYERTVRSEGYEDGFNDGVAEGREEGLEKGREAGREEGARDTKISDARNFLQMNLGTPEQIARALGLSLEEVQELQKAL